MAWATGLKETVYQLRAQGMTTREIEAELPHRFPDAPTPSDTMIWRWLSDPEALPLVKQAEARIRATAAGQAADLVPMAFAGVRAALAQGDLKSADAGSRVIVNLTRGFIQDRIEVTAPVVDAPDELAGLLARHGVALEQRVNAPRLSETAASDDVASS